jgi:uncharacterized protein
MRREEVIEKLKQHESAIRALGARSLYLYGSHARDEASTRSDVDVFIDQDPAKKFGFLELTGLVLMLEDLFETDVDVGTRTGLHPMLRPGIEASAIKVF